MINCEKKNLKNKWKLLNLLKLIYVNINVWNEMNICNQIYIEKKTYYT